MKNSPKNFYNVVDKKKLGIDEAVAVAGEVEQLQTTVGDSSSGLVKQVNDLQTTVDNIDYDISRKADIDGTYPDMTVGNADQLNSTQIITDKVPYVFRTSGGSIDIGNRENDELVGGTLAFNQLYRITSSGTSTEKACTVNRNTDGTITISGTPDSEGSIASNAVANKINHIYFICGNSSDYNKVDFNSQSFGADTGNGAIIKNTSANAVWYYVARIKNEAVGIPINVTIKPIVIDLTQMFGSDVANQIYSIEQAQSGSGVALFRKIFPKAYYAYNAGELMSVKAIAHEMVGFNAYDNATGTAKLLGGNEYQITGTYTAIAYEDINGNAETITPDASGIFTPTNNGTMTVTGGNDTDTCIHLTWTGYRNGEFEPYIKRSYSLDDDLELRGIAKVDGNGNIYYDGDTYENDGTVTRRYGIVDLGTLSWNYSTTNHWFSSIDLINVLKSITVSTAYNMIVGKSYVVSTRQYMENNPEADLLVAVTDVKSLIIRDLAYDDATNFKTALSGVYLVYEVATPTTESADPFQDPQWVDDFGTEEYVDTRDIKIPVGHITKYPANLRDKLQHLPSPTGVDGDYIIREATEVMTLVPAPTGIPELPSVDGTYVLTCTVSDGAATLSWTSNA